MKVLNKKKIIFVLLIIIGIFIRIYKFPSAIPEMNCDEIMTVINATSIAESGKELSGISFPVYLHGWGGQSVVLLYLMSLSIKLLGCSLFSVRLPMLLVSIISLFVFYDLSKKISKSENIALISLGLLVICPWHILQSIWALDCNMFPHFLLFAIDLLYTGITNKKNSLLYISMLFFSISLYCYGIAIYFVPLFLLIFVIYLLKIKSIKLNQVIICVIIFIIFSLPIITMFFINALHINKNISLGILTIPYYESLTRTKDMLFFSPNPIRQFGENLLSTLYVIFLQEDGAEWNAPKLFGATYRTVLIFAIFGLIDIINKFRHDKANIKNFILILWPLISFLTSLIVNKANINRLNSIWYVLLILATLGICSLYEKIRYKKIYKTSIFSLYTIIFIIYSIYFYSFYVNIVSQSGCFSRGFYQTLNYIKALDNKYVLYDNVKNDGCLSLYIQFNNDNSKTYNAIRDEKELISKIQNVKEDEILIVDIENKNYPNSHNNKQIGDFLIITK